MPELPAHVEPELSEEEKELVRRALLGMGLLNVTFSGRTVTATVNRTR